ncbi:MAG: hypothetical protein IIB95_08925 [Candidatus Marinimicrobia bacterium]|nr:hypothetical protein [Candidatus Neomarinimicrobiota bacterium]MCH7763852.1 hypothetical protein [Candidatus Neomarinimicrobiota bacterium]
MKSFGKAIGYGILVWLIPFIVAFILFPIHDSARPLFESVMAVTVCAAAVVFGIAYLKNVKEGVVQEGIRIGTLWFIISILIDAPLMLLGGPMKMSISEYIDDIGITYLCIPVITWGLSVAFSRSANELNPSDKNAD